MKYYRMLAIARKEAIHVLRDWRSLIMGIFIPALLLMLFGFALKLDVDNVPLIIWDQSKTPESRNFISRFTSSRYFAIKDGFAGNYKELVRAIDEGTASLALVIPMDFAMNIAQGMATPVQLIVDGSDSNTATIAMGYADSIARLYSRELLVRSLNKKGAPAPDPPIELEARVWFNEDVESKASIVPGLIGVIMMVISAVLTSLSISREWEKGTMEQLISTPVKVQELILGKLLPYFAIGMIDVLVIIFMGKFVFEVPFRGSFFLLIGMTVIFLIGSLTFGMMISIVTRSQLASSQLAMILTFLPSFLLSGFMTAIANMPEAIRLISYVVPARYFITLLRAIYLKGVGLSVLWWEALLLTVFAIVMAVIANAAFKKKLI